MRIRLSRMHSVAQAPSCRPLHLLHDVLPPPRTLRVPPGLAAAPQACLAFPWPGNPAESAPGPRPAFSGPRSLLTLVSVACRFVRMSEVASVCTLCAPRARCAPRVRTLDLVDALIGVASVRLDGGRPQDSPGIRPRAPAFFSPRAAFRTARTKAQRGGGGCEGGGGRRERSRARKPHLHPRAR